MQNPQIAVSPTDGAVYVSWRRFKYPTQDDAVMVVKSTNGGATFSKPLRVSGLRPFDQATSPTSFRSNGFQTMAIDAHRPRLPGVARPRLRRGAPRPGDRRLAHRHLDVDERRDVDGAARDSDRTASAIS